MKIDHVPHFLMKGIEVKSLTILFTSALLGILHWLVFQLPRFCLSIPFCNGRIHSGIGIWNFHLPKMLRWWVWFSSSFLLKDPSWLVLIKFQDQQHSPYHKLARIIATREKSNILPLHYEACLLLFEMKSPHRIWTISSRKRGISLPACYDGNSMRQLALSRNPDCYLA